MNNRIVITGIGIVDPLGYNRDECYSNLINDYNPIKPVTKIDFSKHTNLKPLVAAETDSTKCVSKDPYFRKAPSYIKQGLHVVEQALESAGHPEELSKNAAVVFSSLGTTGDTRIDFSAAVLENKKRFNPSAILENLQDYFAGYIAISNKLTGIATSVNSACSTGIVGIDVARRLLDNHDFVIVGGSDSMVDVTHMFTFQCLQALTTDGSIPFDVNRNGFTMGEGAGCLILETEERAKQRGATIIAYIDGIGLSNDNFSPTSPDPEGTGAELAMKRAHEEAGSPTIDFVSAHATGTPAGDVAEYKAIRRLFDAPIFSSKGKIGHTMAGCGIIELIHGINILEGGTIPATFNLSTSIAPEDVNLLTSNINKQSKTFIKNSFGFGGRCASIVISK